MKNSLKKHFHSGSQISLNPLKLSQAHLIARRSLLASIQLHPSSLSPENPPKATSQTRTKLNITPDSISKSIPRSRSKIIISSSTKTIEKLSPINPKLSPIIIKQATQRADPIPLVVQSTAYKSVPGQTGKKKKHNQDAFFVLPSFGSCKNQILLGVLDGHGTYGGHVSSYVRSKLPAMIETRIWSDLKSNSDYPLTYTQLEKLKLSLTDAYAQTNTDLNLHSNIDTEYSGTTSVTVLIRGHQCICCNCGDSRAVIGRVSRTGWTAIPVSRDHKPDLPDEKFRIEHNNGRIDSYRDVLGNPLGPSRVWLKNENIPGLAMSRSLGDKAAARAGVICTPEIFVHDLEPNDKFLVLASDGIWEFISSEECVRIVSNFYFSGKISEACEQLVSIATHRWSMQDGNVDDITVVIVMVKVRDE